MGLGYLRASEAIRESLNQALQTRLSLMMENIQRQRELDDEKRERQQELEDQKSARQFQIRMFQRETKKENARDRRATRRQRRSDRRSDEKDTKDDLLTAARVSGDVGPVGPRLRKRFPNLEANLVSIARTTREDRQKADDQQATENRRAEEHLGIARESAALQRLQVEEDRTTRAQTADRLFRQEVRDEAQTITAMSPEDAKAYRRYLSEQAQNDPSGYSSRILSAPRVLAAFQRAVTGPVTSPEQVNKAWNTIVASTYENLVLSLGRGNPQVNPLTGQPNPAFPHDEFDGAFDAALAEQRRIFIDRMGDLGENHRQQAEAVANATFSRSDLATVLANEQINNTQGIPPEYQSIPDKDTREEIILFDQQIAQNPTLMRAIMDMLRGQAEAPGMAGRRATEVRNFLMRKYGHLMNTSVQ